MSAKNNLMSGAIVLLLANAVLLTAVIFGFCPDLKELVLTQVIPSELTDLTNDYRREAQLKELKISPVLTLAAQAKAADMAEKGYFAHTSPDGKTPWFWLKREGYDYLYAGENLAVRFTDSSDVLNAWMKSEKHRKNILDREFAEMGIATAEGLYKGKKAVFVVQMFATPMPALGAALLGPEPVEGRISAVAGFMGDDAGKELYMEFEPSAPAAWSVAMKIVESVTRM